MTVFWTIAVSALAVVWVISIVDVAGSFDSASL
jgi:hypothetical protein